MGLEEIKKETIGIVETSGYVGRRVIVPEVPVVDDPDLQTEIDMRLLKGGIDSVGRMGQVEVERNGKNISITLVEAPEKIVVRVLNFFDSLMSPKSDSD
jgi:hypothetical protein